MADSIVTVVLDRVIDQADLIEEAKADASRAKDLAKQAARVAATLPDGREQFREAFLTLLLAACATKTGRAVSLGHDTLRREVEALRARPDLKAIPALRKADVMARAAERKGLDARAEG